LPPGLALGLGERTRPVAGILGQVHTGAAKQRVVWKKENVNISQEMLRLQKFPSFKLQRKGTSNKKINSQED